jgi:hypothetical protein
MIGCFFEQRYVFLAQDNQMRRILSLKISSGFMGFQVQLTAISPKISVNGSLWVFVSS